MKSCPICGKHQILDWEQMCYSCSQKRYDEQIKYRIETDENYEIFREDAIYCPWCGEKIEFDCDYDLFEAGDHERECPYCERTFNIETEIESKYSTSRPE